MINDELKEFYIQRRQILLSEVDAIERLLGLPRTSQARRYAKDNGWYAGPNITYALDVSEEKSE
jgi:hypothetical protein